MKFVRRPRPPSPLFAVPNVTTHPSTVSVPITVLLCNSPLLYGFNVAIKGLTVKGQTEVPRSTFQTLHGVGARFAVHDILFIRD